MGSKILVVDDEREIAVLTEDQVASYKSGAVKVIEQIAGLSDE